MLFSALIDRICGVRPSQHITSGHVLQKSTAQESYIRYPALPTIVLGLLKGRGQSSDIQGSTETTYTAEIESVLLALEILCRAGFPLENQGNILVSVKLHLRSPIWHIRVLAAKAYALSISIVNSSEISKFLELEGLSQNELHGHLLCVLNLCLRLVEILNTPEGKWIELRKSLY
jgi:hypothetical protein